jgi:hypothetical protein
MKLNQKTSLCLAVLIALSSSGCATLKETFGVRSGEVKVRTKDGYMKVVFSDRDREAIRGYYGKKWKHKKMPPGLAKRATLPPGLQKRLDAGDQLPPGLQRSRLPYELEDILSPLPKGYIHLRVGGDIIIMNQSTEVVVDILKDISL